VPPAIEQMTADSPGYAVLSMCSGTMRTADDARYVCMATAPTAEIADAALAATGMMYTLDAYIK
jgi:hypothetical protein